MFRCLKSKSRSYTCVSSPKIGRKSSSLLATKSCHIFFMFVNKLKPRLRRNTGIKTQDFKENPNHAIMIIMHLNIILFYKYDVYALWICGIHISNLLSLWLYICSCFQPVLSKSNRIFQIRNLISVSSTAKSNFKELGRVNVISDHIS